MVKHTQTIRRQQPKNCFSVFELCVGLTRKRLKWLKEVFRFGIESFNEQVRYFALISLPILYEYLSLCQYILVLCSN